MPKYPQAIVFDFGDTILGNAKWDFLQGNRELLKFCSTNPNNFNEFDIQKRANELDNLYRSLLDNSQLEVSCSAFQKTLYDSLGITFSIDPIEQELVFYKGASNYFLTENVVELLDFIAKQNIRMGIISNYWFHPKTIEHDLNKHGLLKYFEFIMTSSQYGLRKPSEYLFNIACQKLGYNKDSIWFVGDTFSADVVGANQSGLYPVWYNANHIACPESFDYLEIHHWNELIEILVNFRA